MAIYGQLCSNSPGDITSILLTFTLLINMSPRPRVQCAAVDWPSSFRSPSWNPPPPSNCINAHPFAVHHYLSTFIHLPTMHQPSTLIHLLTTITLSNTHWTNKCQTTKCHISISTCKVSSVLRVLHLDVWPILVTRWRNQKQNHMGKVKKGVHS